MSITIKIVQTAGRSINDPFFRDQSFDFALHPETTAPTARIPLETQLVTNTKSVLFDGDDDRIDIGTVGTWNTLIGGAGNLAKAFTLSAWIRPLGDDASDDDYPMIINCGANDRALWIDDSDGAFSTYRVKFHIEGDTDGQYYSTTNGMTAGRWYHVVATYSGDTAGAMNLYINGVVDNATTTATVSSPHAIATTACNIGASNATSYNFKGNISDTAIWSRALSAEEVVALYNGGFQPDLNSALNQGLVSWWRMGDGATDTATTIYDQIGSNNGTTGGSPVIVYTAPRPIFVGSQNFALPDRSGSNSNDTIIVNRFNAPGGYDVTSRGYMDPSHEEKSVYNALSYRNLAVRGSGSGEDGTVRVTDHLGYRRGLQTLDTLYSGHFGIDSQYGTIPKNEYATVPSWHKVNRNRRLRMEQSAQTDVSHIPATNVTGSRYDNAYVSHPIPQSDRQYSWLTASLSSSAAALEYDGPTSYTFFNKKSSVLFDGNVGDLAIGHRDMWDALIGGTGAAAKAFSLSVWMRADGSGPDATPSIINFGNADRRLFVNDADGTYTTYKVRFNIEGGTDGQVDSTAGGMSSGTWYHVVATYSGGTAGTMNLYIDGVVDNATTQAVSVPEAIATYNAHIGATNSNTYNFKGNIDEVSVWNIELTADQVVELYNNGTVKYLPQHSAASSLLSWWQMGDGNGDSSGMIYDQISGHHADVSAAGATLSTEAIGGSRYDGPITYKFENLFMTASDANRQYGGYLYYGEPYRSNFTGMNSRLAIDSVAEDTSLLYADANSVLDVGTYSAKFDGESSWINMGTAATWEELIGGNTSDADVRAFSISLWFYTVDLSATQYLINFGFSDRRIYYNSGTKKLEFQIDGVSSDGYVTNTNELHSNRWYHVVVTYDGANPGGSDTVDHMKIYINGVNETVIKFELNGINSIAGPVGQLGGIDPASFAAPYYNVNGYLADVAIWGDDLTAANVVTLYNGGRSLNIGTSGPDLTDLKAWYRMDKWSGDTPSVIPNRDPTSPAADTDGTGTGLELVRFSPNSVDGLNILNNSRNGPYGWPTFRQIQAGPHSHPVVRNQIKNNRLTVRNNPTFIDNEGHSLKGNSFTSYIEPPVSSQQSAMTTTIVSTNKVIDPDGDERSIDQSIVYNHSFGNKVGYFSNIELNNRLNLKLSTKRGDLYFNRFNEILLNEVAGSTSETPFENLKEVYVNYKQNVYPAGYNTGRNRNRRRLNYSIAPIWADVRADRSKTAGAGPQGSLPRTVPSASIWPLDGHSNFQGVLSRTPRSGSGVLQNALGGYDRYGAGQMSASAIYNMRGMYGLVTNVKAPTVWNANAPATNYAGDAEWQAAEQAGKQPYTTYDKYCDQLRLLGREYSIVPEFRISEHMDYYLNTVGGDFWADNNGFLDLTGSSTSDSSVAGFFKTYSNSDFMKLFSVVDEAYDEKPLINGDIMKKDKLALRCSALVKFLPYKGFYPAERTLELSRLLSSSYGPYMECLANAAVGPAWGTNSIEYAASYFKQAETKPAFRSFTEPLIGPGILFNTIKSGIGVSNWLLRRVNDASKMWSGSKFFNWPFNVQGYPVSNEWKIGGAATQRHVMGSWSADGYDRMTGGDFAEYYGRNSIMAVTMTSSNYHGMRGKWVRESSWWDRYYFEKLPFEALLNPRGYMSTEVLKRAGVGGLAASVDDGKGQSVGFIYDRGVGSGSISASYAIPANNDLPTSTIGGPTNEWNRVRWAGAQKDNYQLAIDNFVCETVDFFQTERGLSSFVSAREDEFKDVVSGSAYGMKVKLYRTVLPGAVFGGYRDVPDTGSFDMYNRPSAFGRPISASLMPAGHAGSTGLCIPSFVHAVPPYYYGSCEATFIFRPAYDGKPTLADIFSNSDIVYTRTGEYKNLYATTNERYINDPNAVWKDLAQQISASVDLKKQVSAVIPGTFSPNKKWLIQSKFETPVLNFANVSASVPLSSSTSAATGSWLSPTKGMWHQYGSIPVGNQGIFLEITPSETVISSSIDNGSTIDNILSLADVCKFETSTTRRIGKIKNKKTVSEAVVAVPFTIGLDGRRKFYRFSKRQRNGAMRILNGDDTSIKVNPDVLKLCRAMKKYVFPPKFDFITTHIGHATVDPFAMFVFEFEKVFSQQDLADIWQNLPPDVTGESLQSQEVAIQHSLLADDFFDSDKRQINSEIRWMVFKVKQRAASNYNRYKVRNLTDDISTVPNSIDTPYTYNWPYDYFSLVELVKMDMGIQYASSGSVDPEIENEAADMLEGPPDIIT